MTATGKTPAHRSGFGARLLEAGFGRPRGVLGRIGGRLMARGNADTERHLVEVADPAENDTVLVVGFGPGIGLREAGHQSRQVTGIDPSPVMLAAARRRCAELIDQGRVLVMLGTAEETGVADTSMDVVLSVNNVMLWADRDAGLRELHRVLKPGGWLLLSAHQKWLPGGRPGLTEAVQHAGYDDVQTWTWNPPGRGAATAAQLSARRPELHVPSY